MVNKSEKNEEVDVEITNEKNETEDIELTDIEAAGAKKMKQLREKIKTCEAEKRKVMDDLQRAKAEFLNAKKRLEEERVQDRTRAKIEHAQNLLPLCDSFQMAMNDKASWEKTDQAWRSGIEGIHMQLMKLLQSYGVKKIDALGKPFNPHLFEAIDTELVADHSQVDMVQKVIQDGYEMEVNDKTEIIRPARVSTGTLAVKND